VAAALSESPGYFAFPVDRNPLQSFLSRSFQAHQAERLYLASLAGLTKEQLHPSCCGSYLVGVRLLEHSLMFSFVRPSLESHLIGNRPE